MGNHHSHNPPQSSGDEKSQNGSGTNTPRTGSKKGMSRSASGNEIHEKPSALVPLEKLGKLLAQISQKEDGVNGITEKSVTKYLFPQYQDLAKAFFRYIHKASKSRNGHIQLAAFKVQCEKLLVVLDDAIIIEIFVRMFGENIDENVVTCDGLRSLLMTSYKLSMDHYPDGPQTCLMIHSTISSVVDACFNNKDSHSVGFVVRWLEEHCHRLIFPVHRYVVHTLSTRYRDMDEHLDSNGDGAGLELATPVLEKQGFEMVTLMPVSVAWLLAGTVPQVYSRPTNGPPSVPSTGSNLASIQFLQRLVCVVPSHWVLLYDSREHGLGSNRFQTHVFSYRGPSLVLVKAGKNLFVIGSPQEWRESHLYWGDKDCVLVQVFPKYSIIEHAPKMLFYNATIRGYPKGLRAGTDPRKPLLNIGEDFDKLEFQGIPMSIDVMEVWGCGDPASREAQLDIKKWQVREAERQRQVKLSAADWMDHPDRYLLELAGRPQYNNEKISNS